MSADGDADQDVTIFRPRVGRKRLPTHSLMLRLVGLVVLVFSAAVLVLSLAFSTMYDLQMRRDVDGLVATKLALGQSIAGRHPPDVLVDKLSTTNIHVRLVTRDGAVFESGPVPRRPTPEKSFTFAQGRHAGSTLTITGEYALARGLNDELRRTRLIVVLAVLVIGAALAWLAVRFALRPLNAMAKTARAITAGERGRRFRPTNPATEIGATATAFDEMLDELEGAERRARLAERAAARANDQLKQFIADAAHELRTPLAGIRGASDTLMLPGVSDDDRAHLHFLLGRETQRAGRLVGSLLDIARLDAGIELRREPVDLVDLTEGECARLRLAHPGLDVRLRVDIPDVVAFGDRERLTSVVSNLVNNAARYADQGASPETPWVEVAVGRDTTHALVGVTDSGPGIPDDQAERVFDRLVRLGGESAATGAGLGLNIARGYARAHGGDITCLRGAPGRGARFLVTLPLRPAGGPPEP